MVDQREVTKERAIEFAKCHGIHKCFETSAKTGSMVEDVFTCAGKELYLQNEKDQEEELQTATPAAPSNPVTQLKPVPGKNNGGERKKPKKGGCC